jgi:plastocyanin
MTSFRVIALAASMIIAASTAAHAEDYSITIKDHVFTPSELTVPAGAPFALRVKNEDATPEEFESHDLKREKIIKGNSEAVIKVGALKPGTYKFFGEFHEKTAQGVITAK